MRNNKSICILGGMGPEASGYLYKLLINSAIKDYSAKNNDEFPEIHLYSIPVPDFISDNRACKKAFEMLKERVKLISKSSVAYLSIACNTAHVLLPELQKVSQIPFISMIEETSGKVSKDGVSKVGLLGTPSTIRYGLYQTALIKHGINVVLPNCIQIKATENIIRNVLKGKILDTDNKKLELIADSLKKNGAQGIILGCTELPLVFPRKYSLPVYNCLEILAMALLKKYYKNP